MSTVVGTRVKGTVITHLQRFTHQVGRVRWGVVWNRHHNNKYTYRSSHHLFDTHLIFCCVLKC